MLCVIIALVCVGCCATVVSSHPIVSYDVLVYGATPGGVAAAVAAGREGRAVVLVEPGDRTSTNLLCLRLMYIESC